MPPDGALKLPPIIHHRPSVNFCLTPVFSFCCLLGLKVGLLRRTMCEPDYYFMITREGTKLFFSKELEPGNLFIKSSYTPIVVSALGRNEQETHKSQLLSIKMRVLMTWLAGPGWEIWKSPPPPPQKKEICWI